MVSGMARAVECALVPGNAGGAVAVEQPGLEDAVEALFLALGLWMPWPAVHDPDAQIHQP